MGNKLSCSCTPLIKKAYKETVGHNSSSQMDEKTPFQPRREGRLWAEVFTVPPVLPPGGVPRWQQVSDDLVPVNIRCLQEVPGSTPGAPDKIVFKITAYNRQVEKILDVILRQPGTRLGQASECFVYWKDPSTGETWGLNFTSPVDARQFRELCSGYTMGRPLGRKSSHSSYSLRETSGQTTQPPYRRTPAQESRGQKRKPQSTPSSPRRGGYGVGGQPQEELQCTCMTAEALHRQRNGRVRYTASATLPKSFRQDSAGSQSSGGAQPVSGGPRRGIVHQGSTSSQQPQPHQMRSAQYSRAQYAAAAQSSQQQRRQISRSFESQTSQQPVGGAGVYPSPQQQSVLSQQQPPYRTTSAQVGQQVGRGGITSRQQQQQLYQQQLIQQQQQQQQGPRSKSSDDVRRTARQQQPGPQGQPGQQPPAGGLSRRLLYPLKPQSSVGQESTASRDSRRSIRSQQGQQPPSSGQQGTCRPKSVPYWACPVFGPSVSTTSTTSGEHDFPF